MDKVAVILRETGAMLEGHFLLSSGRHSNLYFQCAKLFQYPDKAKSVLEQVVNNIRSEIEKRKIKVDIVAGPAMGGIIAAWEVARQLGVPSVFTERDDNGFMALRRGFEIIPKQNVLIVEDVVTTGKSFTECAGVLKEKGAVITALACVVDRRKENAIDIPWLFYPAARFDAGNWDVSECELCRKGIPIIKPGSRKI
jgi:orotate phosphoribosyltransferase